MENNSVIIIGAGFAGLSAGIYARMNGYSTQIFEMHDSPGGLCTAWKRKGYTIDGCIHWLAGSSPGSGMHRYWEEVGIAQGCEFINMDEYMRYESADGRTLILYTNVDKLEKHLLEFSPQDAIPIRDFIRGIRMCLNFDQPSESDPPLKRLQKRLKFGLILATKGREMRKWMNISGTEFFMRFKDPVLREALREMWVPEFSMFVMLFAFAYLHNRDAGYPIGGSLPMSLALARRYTSLGGVIHYDKQVKKILVEKDKAVGVRLEDGSEHRSGQVISAADGYATIFKMLEGKYADEKTREPYEKWQVFQPLLYVGLGVNRSFENEPRTVSGMSFPLRQPTEIGYAMRDRMPIHIYNQDSTLAPAGKTSLVVMMPSSYEYWKELAQNPEAYKEKKEQVAHTVVELLNQRFPGISQQVEMVDVATPLTFERYTGNWKGSFEGWLLTPQNSFTMMKRMSQTLPGLQNFYMCGQWVEPGGGLPTSVMSGRRLVKTLCKQDGKKFRTTVA
ncbi:MAG: NAD(P)/FAD-dependent oxidoreductase [Calditrichaeota bacterium]|nr:NAD(P)/FAD-dependent oxidoreductase [Calditrichota bacterium]